MTATYWNGAQALCQCGSENVESRDDVDHDDGTCERFECLDCGHRWHNELPD